MRRIFATIIALLCICVAPAAPQFSLVTFYPGAQVYQLEGHTGLRLLDAEAGIDVIYNWGVFDFNAPNFLYRFVKGETDYMLGVEPASGAIAYYVSEGRRVVEQKLDLDSAQNAALLQAVMHNLEHERIYRYNYVLDNCATRPLRLIERSLGEGKSLQLGTPTVPSDNTFRKVMRRYHANYPWYQFGIDLALGSGIDRPLPGEYSAFAPVELEAMLQGAVIEPDGRRLVNETLVLNPGVDATLPPTPWYLTPMAFSVVILALSLCVFRATLKGRQRRLCNLFRSVLFLIEGIDGLLIVFLVFISVHEATSPNWLLLWLNPLWLVTAAVVWMRPRRWTAILRCVQCVLVLICAVLGICGVQSYNPAFYPLMAATVLCAIPRR